MKTKLINKLIAAASVLALIAFPGTANAAGWNFPNASTVPYGSTLIAINEASYFDVWNSWESVKTGPFTGIGPEAHICPNGPDENFCNPANNDLNTNSILGYCQNAADENCIEGLSLKTKTGEWVKGEFTGMTSGFTYTGKPELNLISAANPSLFKVAGVPHAFNGETYATVVKVKQRYDVNTKKYVSVGLNAVVIPYTVRPGGSAPRVKEAAGPDGVTRVWTNHDSTCTWSDDGRCGVAEDFTDGTRVQLTFRISNEITGWFRGRISNPEASITQYSPTSNKVVFTADPVNVARFAAYATKENTPADWITRLERNGGHNPTRELFTGESIKDFWSTNGNNFEVLEAFRNATKDTAAGVSSLWNFSTIEGGGFACKVAKDQVMGFVSTNATVYNGQTPTFNSATGELVYKVAGLHYAPDGKTLNEGTYDLMMRSDLARCLYGFSSAPISAKISVMSEAGETKVATTVVKEADGWLTLRAAGFTFSSPTISVKLTQASAKKTTITCVKGKLTKKVTAVGPRCPAGYKKK